MAAIFEHSSPVKLLPKPGFVVKTKVVEGRGTHSYGRKVFINICHDGQVPKPPGDYDLEEIFARIMKNEWEIPIVVSLEKTESDKKGVPSLVYDCCINSDTFVWVHLNNDLRLILIEWAIESVETMHDLVLEREYTIPKMLSKGKLSETEITQNDLTGELQERLGELRQNGVASLIEQLMPDDENEDKGPLPDIMNIGRTSKPLIKEIEELSIDEKEESEKRRDNIQNEDGRRDTITLPILKDDDLMREQKTTIYEKSVGFSNQKRSSKIFELESLRSSKTSITEVLEYTFTLSLNRKDDHFYLIFHSEQLTEHLEVSYLEESKTLLIKNHDLGRRLGPDNILEITLPNDVIPYKVFVVKTESNLYVFGKVSD